MRRSTSARHWSCLGLRVLISAEIERPWFVTSGRCRKSSLNYYSDCIRLSGRHKYRLHLLRTPVLGLQPLLPHTHPETPLMNLHFELDEEDDILNTTIRDSGTGPVMYIVETPKCAEGTLATTVTKRNQADGSTRFAFRILWRGAKRALEDVSVVLDSLTLEEVPVRQVLESSPGAAT